MIGVSRDRPIENVVMASDADTHPRRTGSPERRRTLYTRQQKRDVPDGTAITEGTTQVCQRSRVKSANHFTNHANSDHK